MIVLRGCPSPLIREYRTSQDLTPEAKSGLLTVVSTGNEFLALKVLSNPVTITSSGTLIPFAWSLFMAVRAILSLAQIIACGGFGMNANIRSSSAMVGSFQYSP